jgi:potassium-transporting ATPase KdpC subunit
MNTLIVQLRISLMATLFLAVILCGIYPLTVWTLAQGLFPDKANGSLLTARGKIVGSSLIAQGFASPKYFRPRPSAAGQGYDATSSGGSNLGPLSKKMVDTVRQRADEYRSENHLPAGAMVPIDAVTASASGLDPHISVKNALIQAPRVAKARGLSEDLVLKQIKLHTEGRDLGILGEPRVKVLMLNLALDGTPVATSATSSGRD